LAAPDTTGGVYSAPTDPLAGFKGLLLKGGTGGEGWESEGRKCRVPPYTFE